MEKFEMKFMFDWGSRVCIWAANDEARKKYGYSVKSEQLPISENLVRELNMLIRRHDEALDWDCPQNGLLWTKEQQEKFIERAKSAYSKLCMELDTDHHLILGERL